MNIPDLQTLVSLCESQGKEVIALCNQTGLTDPVKQKSSHSDLVTQVDTKTEESLRKKLQDLMPEAGFWGEEGGKGDESEYMWVVDPIDGTTNLAHGYRHSSISVALTKNNKPVLGVVHNIFARETFFAEAEGAAYCRFEEDAENTRIEVSNIKELSGSLLSFGLPYDKAKGKTMLNAANALFPEVQDLRRSGSAALDIAYVACGRIEAHFEVDLRPWDLMAACLILERSGGMITDWKGEEITSWDGSDKFNVICSNGHVGSLISQKI